MRGLIVWGVLIAIGAIGAFIFRDRITGAADDLAVGDCFDEPTVMVDISEVQHHPCNEAHTAEVVFVGDYTGSDAYPPASAFETFVANNCVSAFTAYTGRSFDTDPELTMGYFIPNEDGWTNGGDREVMCYLARVDEAQMTSSMRLAAP